MIIITEIYGDPFLRIAHLIINDSEERNFASVKNLFTFVIRASKFRNHFIKYIFFT